MKHWISEWIVVLGDERFSFPSFRAALSYADGRIIRSGNLIKELDPANRTIQISSNKRTANMVDASEMSAIVPVRRNR